MESNSNPQKTTTKKRKTKRKILHKIDGHMSGFEDCQSKNYYESLTDEDLKCPICLDLIEGDFVCFLKIKEIFFYLLWINIGCNLRKYFHNDSWSSTLKSKFFVFQNQVETKEVVFLQNRKKMETEIFAFWVITFEPNKIKTHSAP